MGFGGGLKSHAAPLPGDGIDRGHIELCIARLMINVYRGFEEVCDRDHAASKIFRPSPKGECCVLDGEVFSVCFLRDSLFQL